MYRQFLQMLCLAVALPLAGLAGYLPCIGPAPIRFESPPAPPVQAVVASAPTAPAQATAEDESENTFWPFVPPEPPDAAADTVVVIESSSHQNESESNNAGAANAMGYPPAEASIAPQLLLPHFQYQMGRSNAPARGVYDPLIFVPPLRPLPPPARKSAYSVQ